MNPRSTTALRALHLPVALAALVTVLVTVFAWPASNLGPRDLPVAVSGSQGFVTRTTDALNAQGAGAFDITVAPDHVAGRTMLRDNDVSGLFEESPRGPRLVLASAGRPAVAALLTSVETSMTQAAAPDAIVDDVPPPADDTHSAAFTAAALPTVLGAIAAGVILALSRRSRSYRILGGLVIAGLSGVGIAAVLNSWLGVLAGSWWAVAACYALGVGAVVAAISGVGNLFGRAGVVAAAATLMLLGNPLSGATSSPEMLPDGWSAVGRILPPGALENAVRAVAYYDDNGASSPVLVLAAWGIVGCLLIVAGPAPRLRRPQAARGRVTDH